MPNDQSKPGKQGKDQQTTSEPDQKQGQRIEGDRAGVKRGDQSVDRDLDKQGDKGDMGRQQQSDRGMGQPQKGADANEDREPQGATVGKKHDEEIDDDE